MKRLEFRKLIREEVRKVIREANAMLPNVGFQLNDIYENPKGVLAKDFSMFAKVETANTIDSETIKGTITLNVDALMNLLKSNKGYAVLETNADGKPRLDIENTNSNQVISLYKSKIPRDVVKQLTSIVRTKPNNKNPVEKYADDIIDIISSGAGLDNPDFVEDLETMVKEIKAKNLLAQVSKELAKAVKSSEFDEESIATLKSLGFFKKG